MSDLLAVAVVSGIFSVIGIGMINYFWILKQEYRHKYLIKRYNLGKADKKNIISQSTVEQPSTLSSLAKILPALQNIDLDQVGDLVERLQGSGSGETEQELGELGSLLSNPAIQGILQGLGSKQQPQQTNQEKLASELFYEK